MARIVSAEILMVNLAPKVERTDAIQAFVSQETPIVRITDADGRTGTGYSYRSHRRTGHHQPLKETLMPRLIGREAEEIGGSGATFVRDACDRCRGDHIAGTCRHRHRAAGPALPSRRPASMADGGWCAAERSALHD